VGDDRFGPNTAQVEAFLERLRHLTPAQWEKIMDAAPGIGAIPELEIKQAPEYFRAFDAATRIAKSDVFPGSESAFYEAMRQAQLIADTSAFNIPSHQDGEAPSTPADDQAPASPEAQAEAITRLMSTAYEEEGRRRVMNACMMAAGALVVRHWLARVAFERLYAPLAATVELKRRQGQIRTH
jgi:hypothetical protein